MYYYTVCYFTCIFYAVVRRGRGRQIIPRNESKAENALIPLQSAEEILYEKSVWKLSVSIRSRSESIGRCVKLPNHGLTVVSFLWLNGQAQRWDREQCRWYTRKRMSTIPKGLTALQVRQTPSAGLRHHSSNHCHNYLRHKFGKLSANEQFLFCFVVDAQMAVSL